jgi:1-acyl-sn-glycerol-3-phosphate acyltransferase
VIPARKSRFLSRWFSGHVAGRLGKTFGKLEIRGLGHLQRAVHEGSVLVVSNHTSWWDPMFCIYLANRLAAFDGYALMLAKNLERLPFLGRVGGFGVEIGDAADARRALRYGAALLAKPGRVVWVFPQGIERPITESLVDFKPGAAMMAKLAAQQQIIGVGLRYEFGAAEKPTLLASIGEPFGFDTDVRAGALQQQRAVDAELAAIEQHVREPRVGDGFAPVMSSRPSVLSAWAEKALAWLTRYR